MTLLLNAVAVWFNFLASKINPICSSDRPADAFQTEDKNLTVSNELSDTHMLRLNKFNVVPYHSLVITRDFEPQANDLNEADWSPTLSVMAVGPLPTWASWWQCWHILVQPSSWASLSCNASWWTFEDGHCTFIDIAARHDRTARFAADLLSWNLPWIWMSFLVDPDQLSHSDQQQAFCKAYNLAACKKQIDIAP